MIPYRAMGLCPWCKTDIGEVAPNQPCPKCKRVPVEHPWIRDKVAPPVAPLGAGDLELDLSPAPPRAQPAPARASSPSARAPAATATAPARASTPAMNAVMTAASVSPPAPRTASGPQNIPSFEGELDLGRAAPPPPPSAPRAAQAPMPSPSGRSVMDDDEDLMMAGGGADLALDLGGGAGLPPRLSSGTHAAVASMPVPPAPTSNRALAPPPTSYRNLPAVTEAPDPAAIDRFEALATADYGPPPENVFLTPLYAWRVLQRKGQLRRSLALKREEAARATQRAEDAVIAFAERVRPLAEKAGSRAMEAVRAAEDVMRSRDGSLAGEMDAHRAELARIDERLAVVESELAQARAEEKAIEAELAQVVEAKKRADAKVKRADIEIRNATQLLATKKGTPS